ncbi:hypothetical protein chiPu_0025988 [Chiloscyllium punctatum]|uniref:Uncharacterized protein n=1 Tax=Chiloscyllium punctatum TaxID=137246 RepID=A0A401THH0_CHIPU|nr:hypothetical protein [Chiloscyllium punctatum]
MSGCRVWEGVYMARGGGGAYMTMAIVYVTITTLYMSRGGVCGVKDDLYGTMGGVSGTRGGSIRQRAGSIITERRVRGGIIAQDKVLGRVGGAWWVD